MTHYVWKRKVGSKSHLAKLNEQQVLAIRNAYKLKPDMETRKEMAKKYKVSDSTIRQIVMRERWTHI